MQLHLKTSEMRRFPITFQTMHETRELCKDFSRDVTYHQTEVQLSVYQDNLKQKLAGIRKFFVSNTVNCLLCVPSIWQTLRFVIGFNVLQIVPFASTIWNNINVRYIDITCKHALIEVHEVMLQLTKGP